MFQTYADEGEYRAAIAEERASERERSMCIERQWNRSQYKDFLEGYIACGVWLLSDPGTQDDVNVEAYAEMDDQCLDFVRANMSDLYDLDPARCGHDFWLTRNGHGSGFWDRGYGAAGDRLSDAARAYGVAELYTGDDGYISYHG